METYTQFFELLQVAIGTRERLSTTLSPDEWEQLYVIAKEQTLTGIAFAALERLPQSNCLHRDAYASGLSRPTEYARRTRQPLL